MESSIVDLSFPVRDLTKCFVDRHMCMSCYLLPSAKTHKVRFVFLSIYPLYARHSLDSLNHEEFLHTFCFLFSYVCVMAGAGRLEKCGWEGNAGV